MVNNLTLLVQNVFFCNFHGSPTPPYYTPTRPNGNLVGFDLQQHGQQPDFFVKNVIQKDFQVSPRPPQIPPGNFLRWFPSERFGRTHMVPYGTTRYHKVPYGTIWHHKVPFGTIRYHMIPPQRWGETLLGRQDFFGFLTFGENDIF